MPRPHPPIEAIDPDSPERVRTYVPERAIEGGLSTVFLAQRQPDTPDEDVDSDELMLGRVALKLATKSEEITLLHREAEILSAVHAHHRPGSRIVRIGADGKVLKLVSPPGLPGHTPALIELEYLDGQTLAEWFKTKWQGQPADDPLDTVEIAVSLVKQLAEALIELSEVDKVVLHRDIKPENIMLTSTGLRLFDFNVARHDGRGPKTEYVGTLTYMAPEVRDGLDYDRRADLYSLGVIFYELLLHRRFASADLGANDKDVWGSNYLVSLPRKLRSQIGELIHSLITHHSQRMGSAAEVCERLKEIEEGLRARRDELAGGDLATVDLIQLVAELRPSGQHAVVADGRDMSGIERTMRARLRVHDPLEDWLEQRIRSAADMPEWPTLVILAGNAGDGKSHIIDRLVNHCLASTKGLREKVHYIADATHADSPSQSQQARLEEFFAPFAEEEPNAPAPVSLIAMNTGMVIRFFEHAADRFTRGESTCGDLSSLYRNIRIGLGLLRLGNTAEEPSFLPFNLEVVNLDLRDPLRPGSDGTSFFQRMLDRLDPEHRDTLLHEKWRTCNGCSARARCSVHFNLEALRTAPVRKALTSVMERAALDPEVHLSPRLLWGFLYRIITGGLERYDMRPGESGPCEVVRRRVDDCDWLLAGHFTEVLFASEAPPNAPLWHALARLDPAFSPVPRLDELHTRLSLQQYRDDSEQEINALGGADGTLAGLHLRDLLAHGNLPLSRRRDAAIRRRVFFDSKSLEAFDAWGAHNDFRILLNAYEQYSRSGSGNLSNEHKQALQSLAKDITQVFLRGCGRTFGSRRFLRVSQPHPRSASQLLVEVDQAAFDKLFRLGNILQPDPHVDAHRGHPELLDHLGYRPHMVHLSLVSNRLLVDLDLYDFLRQVQDGRQPSKQDLAQFEALLFIGEQIGNHLASPASGPAVALYVFDEPTGTLHKLYVDDFGDLTIEPESY